MDLRIGMLGSLDLRVGFGEPVQVAGEDGSGEMRYRIFEYIDRAIGTLAMDGAARSRRRRMPLSRLP